MPLMHSEQLADQEQCCQLFEEQAAEAEARGYAEAAAQFAHGATYARAHRDVVAK